MYVCMYVCMHVYVCIYLCMNMYEYLYLHYMYNSWKEIKMKRKLRRFLWFQSKPVLQKSGMHHFHYHPHRTTNTLEKLSAFSHSQRNDVYVKRKVLTVTRYSRCFNCFVLLPALKAGASLLARRVRNVSIKTFYCQVYSYLMEPPVPAMALYFITFYPFEGDSFMLLVHNMMW